MSAQMTPDQAKFLLALTLPIIKTEHETTKRVIEAIPLDKGDYRPEPVAKSALELAWHIVAAEHRFLGGICVGKFDFTPGYVDKNQLLASSHWPLALSQPRG
jgi:hypothetical protein